MPYFNVGTQTNNEVGPEGPPGPPGPQGPPGDPANTEELTTKVESFTQQLADTVRKDDLSNVLDGSPKGTYATLVDLQLAHPAGGTGIYIVTEDGNWYYWNDTEWTAGGVYQATEISDKSVTTKKTDFMESVEVGTDKKDISTQFTITGKVSTNNGIFISGDTTYVSTDFIDVSGVKKFFRYVLDGSYTAKYIDYGAVFYNEENNFISSIGGGTDYVLSVYDGLNGREYAIPEGAKYVRFSMLLAKKKGGTSNEYTYLKITPIVKNKVIDDYNLSYIDTKVAERVPLEVQEYIENNDLPQQEAVISDNTIPETKLNFLNQSPNLFNPQDLTVGYSIDVTTGELVESEEHSVTGFIEVVQGAEYFVGGTCAIRKYTKTGSYAVGTPNTSGVMVLGTSANVAKVRLVILNTQIYNFRLYKGNVDLGKVDYGYSPTIISTQKQEKEDSKKISNIVKTYEHEKNLPFEKLDLIKDATIANTISVLRKDYTIKWRDDVSSIKVNTVNNTSHTVTFTQPTPVDLMGISEMVLMVYVEDITKVTNFSLSIVGTSWVRSGIPTKNGWNVIRYQTSAGNITTWDTAVSFGLTAYASKGTAYNIANLFAIRHNKARILFVNDHGYHRFKELAYPQLKARGIPTTWAINPSRLGYSPIGQSESILTQADIEELAKDPYSEFSFHTLDPSKKTTESMTAEELRAETHEAMHYLKKNGAMPRYFWRAAFVGNKAPFASKIQDMMEAYASPTEGGGIELFPFRDRYNINRVAIHGRDNAYFDTTFDTLKKCRPVYVCYTHGLDESAGIHIDQATFDYFLSKIDVAISEGWIEGTTYSKLRAEYSNFDEMYINYVDSL